VWQENASRLQTVSLWIRSKIQFGCIGASKWAGEFFEAFTGGACLANNSRRAGTGTEVAAQRSDARCGQRPATNANENMAESGNFQLAPTISGLTGRSERGSSLMRLYIDWICRLDTNRSRPPREAAADFQRAIACNGRRQVWCSWHVWQSGICILRRTKGPAGFESHPLRHCLISLAECRA